MNIIRILLKEFKQNIRNWKANVMMILFPVVLITILGAAFSGVFSSNIKLGGINLLYTVKSEGYLSNSFRNFTKEENMTFTETADEKAALEGIKNGKYTCYIQVDSADEEIIFYKNEKFGYEANIAESIIKAFAQRYSAFVEISKTNPAVIPVLMADTSNDFVKTQNLDKSRTPTSLDYYAVTMLTLIIMYSSLTGMWSIRSELTLKTGSRILCSPVRKTEVLLGKVMGCILVTLVQVGVVIIFSKFVMRAYWGMDIFTPMLLVLVESIMAISIGTGISYLIKNDGAASGIMNTIIPVMALFGGGYVPLDVMSPAMLRISVISPVKWVNDAIFRVIYNNDYSLVPVAVAVNLAVAAFFIAVSTLLSRKEAV